MEGDLSLLAGVVVNVVEVLDGSTTGKGNMRGYSDCVGQLGWQHKKCCVPIP